MAIELATAYVSVVPSFQGGARALTSGLDRGLDDEGVRAGRRFAGGFSASIAPALKGIAAAAGAAFAVDFVGDAIGQASSLEESISKNTVVFGDMSDEVLAFANNAARSLGQSKRQALEATGVFGNLLRSVGLSGEASADMSVDLTKLASDLASFNNVPVDDALTALRSGLVGETEPLKRFGVNLNEATLKAKALALGLSDGKKPLDANAKAQAAYALILEQTALAQGDFSRTSDGLANQQRILSAQFEDAKASLGNALLPIMTTAVNFVNDQVIPGFQALARVFDEEGLAGVMDRLGDKFQEALPIIGGVLADLGESLIRFVQEQGPKFAAKLGELALELVKWVGPQIPPLLLELGKLMGEVGLWIIRDGVPLLTEKAKDLAIGLISWVTTEAIPGLIHRLPGIINRVGMWIKDEGVPAFIDFGEELGRALFEGFVESFGSLFGDSFEFLKGADLGFEVPFLASGGRAEAHKVHVVGERGPEFFVPDVSGTVYPTLPTVSAPSGPLVGVLNVTAIPGEDPVMTAMRELKRVQLLAA